MSTVNQEPIINRRLRPTILRMHNIAGVLIAPFIFIAAFSGVFYAAAPSVEQIFYDQELRATSDLPPQPVSDQIQVAQSVFPDLELQAVQTSDDPQATTRVIFTDESLPSSSYSQAVFIDPGDLTVTGTLVQYGSSRSLPLRAWLSEGHRSLWLGESGRWYAELAASWMGALALGGGWLWWEQRRRSKQKSQTKRGVARRNHYRIGAIAVPGLLFLTLTGLTWSKFSGENLSLLRQRLNWLTPKPDKSLPVDATGTGADPLSQVDTVLNSAREAGLSGDISASFPSSGDAWVVQELRQAWRLETDTLVLDGAGVVIRDLPFSDWPVVAKLTAWLIQLHMGTLFGVINQLVLGAIGVSILAIIFFGYRMCFLRGSGTKSSRLLPRNSRGQVGKPELAVLIVLMIIYAIIAPLFGITLLLFLMADWVWDQTRRRARASEKQQTTLR